MAEVLINLIGNGIKFTPAGGKVAVDLRGLTEKRDYLKVVVSDTGVGIAAEDLPKIFGRFYQGQKTEAGLITGTGLGLAITKEIIEGHQGDIRPESGAGGGSSFVFTLPIFGISTLYSLILDPMFEEAEQDKLPLSLTRVEFWDQRAGREVALNRDSWESVVYALQKLVRSVDVIIPFQNRVVYIFSFIASKMAREIGERIQVKLTLGGYLPKGIEVRFKSFSHPGEALTKEDFLKGCRLLLKED